MSNTFDRVYVTPEGGEVRVKVTGHDDGQYTYKLPPVREGLPGLFHTCAELDADGNPHCIFVDGLATEMLTIRLNEQLPQKAS